MTDRLDRDFAELRRIVQDPDRLSPARSEPFFNFVHRPEDTLAVRRNLTRWTTLLGQDGWDVRVESLARLLWQAVDESGRWDSWLEAEDPEDWPETNNAIRDVLRDKEQETGGRTPGIARRVVEIVADTTPRRLVLLTDAGLLHPWFRVRTLESWVHSHVRSPTVVLYPGRRAGMHGLHFLGFYAEDANYRSRLVGGTP